LWCNFEFWSGQNELHLTVRNYSKPKSSLSKLNWKLVQTNWTKLYFVLPNYTTMNLVHPDLWPESGPTRPNFCHRWTGRIWLRLTQLNLAEFILGLTHSKSTKFRSRLTQTNFDQERLSRIQQNFGWDWLNQIRPNFDRRLLGRMWLGLIKSNSDKFWSNQLC